MVGGNSGELVTSISTISEFEDDVLIYRMCMLCVLSSQPLYVPYSIVHVELLPFCQFLNIHTTELGFWDTSTNLLVVSENVHRLT